MKLVQLIFTLSVGVFSISLFGATVTFIGDGYWEDGTSWDLARVPAS